MRLSPLLLPLFLSLLSCAGPDFLSPDCTSPVPANLTRIYIGTPAPGGQQSGTSRLDPLDGTTADKFDTILRTIAEGQFPTWGTQSQIPPENLIVCIGTGVFHTNGQYDWVIGEGHTQGKENIGFTVGKNWRIHGQDPQHTILELDSFVTSEFKDQQGNAFVGGRNTAIGTQSEDASGVQVSDLTINANHDNLNRTSGLPLNLSAIVLRSVRGSHWIHDVNVVGASGDLGIRNIIYESFPIRIWGDSRDRDPSQNQGSLIEQVSLKHPGRPVDPDGYPGGALTAISISNAGAEVRNNVVDGYSIAYGGWNMRSAWFHHNLSSNNRYGFNTDSFSNIDVLLESNQIMHPATYGIVIGGSNSQQRFSGWRVLNNTIELDSSGTVGIVVRGQVQGATFSGNKVFTDSVDPEQIIAIWSYSSGNGVANEGNIYQDNHFDRALAIDFSADPDFNTDCRIRNRDLQDRPLADFPDNSGPSGCFVSRAPSHDLRDSPGDR